MTELTLIAAGVMAIAQPPTTDLPPLVRPATTRPTTISAALNRAASGLPPTMPGLQRQEDAWIALMAENTRPELSTLPPNRLPPSRLPPNSFPPNAFPPNGLSANTVPAPIAAAEEEMIRAIAQPTPSTRAEPVQTGQIAVQPRRFAAAVQPGLRPSPRRKLQSQSWPALQTDLQTKMQPATTRTVTWAYSAIPPRAEGCGCEMSEMRSPQTLSLARPSYPSNIRLRSSSWRATSLQHRP